VALHLKAVKEAGVEVEGTGRCRGMIGVGITGIGVIGRAT